jgi:hypothetical protein
VEAPVQKRERRRGSEVGLGRFWKCEEGMGRERCTSSKTGDIDAGKEGGDDGFGLVEVDEPVESLVGDGDSGWREDDSMLK